MTLFYSCRYRITYTCEVSKIGRAITPCFVRIAQVSHDARPTDSGHLKLPTILIGGVLGEAISTPGLEGNQLRGGSYRVSDNHSPDYEAGPANDASDMTEDDAHRRGAWRS